MVSSEPFSVSSGKASPWASLHAPGPFRVFGVLSFLCSLFREGNRAPRWRRFVPQDVYSSYFPRDV
jgi:hypothetical protein